MQSKYDMYSLFWQRVTKRVKQGEREYGNFSFESSPLTLVEEVQQELEDVVGWGYILWSRLERAKHVIARIETKEMMNDPGTEADRDTD